VHFLSFLTRTVVSHSFTFYSTGAVLFGQQATHYESLPGPATPIHKITHDRSSMPPAYHTLSSMTYSFGLPKFCMTSRPYVDSKVCMMHTVILPPLNLIWRLMHLLGMKTHVRLHTWSGREPTNENEERGY